MMKRLFIPVCRLCMTTLLLCAGREQAQAETVNPHFTGKHCIECHEASPPALRFGGDISKICVRCHDRATAATFEPHPVNVAVSEALRPRIPAKWPLADNTITCRTCHDVLLQMHEAPAARIANPSFLRGDSRSRGDAFCFVCHDRTLFKKNNPHRQIGDNGSIIPETCLVCHSSVPDPEAVTVPEQAKLRSSGAHLCGACHQHQMRDHPTRGRHLVAPSAAVSRALAAKQTDTPLLGGEVHCATCHNPHAAGVLRRQTGAGEPALLRRGGGAALCLVCHPGRDRKRQTGRAVVQSPTAAIGLAPHKPWAEGKCKACHAICRPDRAKPDDTALCVRQGCHEQDFLNKAFVHEPSVLSRCSLCHTSHSSGHEKLLRADRDRVCIACHTLLRTGDGTVPLDAERKQWVHAAVLAATADTVRVTCKCHDQRHGRDITHAGFDRCADCHGIVKQIAQQAAGGLLISHDRYSGKPCTACHDPHAGPYRCLLKEPPAAYGVMPEQKNAPEAGS